MLEALAPYVLYPIGVYALLAIPIILIFYFLKKKTKTIALPSFMFLLEQQGKVRRRWFPRLPFNWLLIIHVLLALTLTVALLAPFYTSPEAQTKEEVIIILDNSASMQANGFLSAKQAGLDATSKINTIIITSPKPEILLQRGSKSQAQSILNAIKATDAPGNLKQTLGLVNDLNIQNAAMHVLSDFQEDVLGQLQASGNNIILPQEFSEQTSNVGFVDATITKSNISVLIKNFNDVEKQIGIDIQGSTQEITIPANEFTRISFPTPQSQTKISLTPLDNFPVDNYLYLSPTVDTTTYLLYITENPSQYTNSMLEVVDFIAKDNYAPPGTLQMTNYEGYILENVDASKLLPSNFEDMLTQVSRGGVLIIKASDSLQNLEIRPEYPYVEQKPKKTAEIEILPHQFTENLATISEESIFPIQPKEDATVLVQTVEGEAVVAYRNYGDGIIMYYGIDDASPQSTFKRSYAYPILFKRIMEQSYDIQTITDLHLKAGEEILTTANIQTPTEVAEGPLVTKNIGFHTSGSTYAVNLLNQEESDVSRPSAIAQYQQYFTQGTVPVSITPYILMLAALLLLIEFIFIKQRGDY